MQIVQIICNVCGIAKGETNHWFKAVIDPLHPVGIAFGSHEATIGDPTGLEMEHICGQACLHKRLFRWIEALPTSTKKSQESEQL